MSMEEWEQQDTSITTEQLDAAVNEMYDLKVDYDAKKKVSNDAHAAYEEQRFNVVSLLKAAGKSKYFVEGIGTVGVSEQLKVKFPTTPESRGEFFGWLNKELGADGFLAYATVNYGTLNSLYNEQFALAADKGDADNFEIPGINPPQSESKLTFRTGK